MTTLQSIRPMEDNFGSRLRVVFWHFPLPNHKHGREAAMAAEAASRQGKFWEMHDLLFERQGDWSKVDDIHPVFEAYAQELKLNVERFKKDFGSPMSRPRRSTARTGRSARSEKYADDFSSMATSFRRHLIRIAFARRLTPRSPARIRNFSKIWKRIPLRRTIDSQRARLIFLIITAVIALARAW